VYIPRFLKTKKTFLFSVNMFVCTMKTQLLHEKYYWVDIRPSEGSKRLTNQKEIVQCFFKD